MQRPYDSKLGIHTTITKIAAAAGTRRDTASAARLERVLFALVAARAIDPASKLATAAWLGRRTWIHGLTDTVTHDGTHDDTGTGTTDNNAGAAAGTTATYGADTGSALISDDEC